MSRKQPLSQLIKFDSTRNTRDLGGFVGDGGRTVKYKKLYRSDHLADMTDEDKSLIKTLGVSTVVDLRSTEEVLRQPDVPLDGVTNVHMPIKPDGKKLLRGKPEGENLLAWIIRTDKHGNVLKTTTDQYRTLVHHPHTQKMLRLFLERCLSQRDGAVLFHCTAGKDRTGMCAALLLSLLGVDAEAVRADYLDSNAYLAGRIDEIVSWTAREVRDEKVLSEVRLMCMIAPDYFDAVTDAVIRQWGSIEGYAEKALDFDRAKIEGLRERYLM